MEEIQYFEQKNISMSRPTSDTISPSKNGKEHFTISPSQNGKWHFIISPSQNGKEHFIISDPPQLTRPTEFTEQNGKGHVPDDPDPYPSSSDSSPKKKKRNKKKNRRKYRKDDSLDPSSSDNYDSSDDSDFRRKGRKRESDWKKYRIKLCAHLTTKFLTTAYISNIIRFKMDKDPLHCQIYFLTFVESPEIIF